MDFLRVRFDERDRVIVDVGDEQRLLVWQKEHRSWRMAARPDAVNNRVGGGIKDFDRVPGLGRNIYSPAVWRKQHAPRLLADLDRLENLIGVGREYDDC